MFRPSPWLCRGGLGLAALTVGLLGARFAGADTLPAEGSNELKKQYEKKEARELYQRLEKGEVAATDEHLPVIDTAAKWFTQRVTWVEYNKEPGQLNKLVKEFEAQLESAKRNLPANQKFLQLLQKQMVVRLLEVVKLRDDQLIDRINAARMLAYLGKFGYEDVLDAYTAILEDPKQHDAVKDHILEGMKDVFAQTWAVPPVPIKDKKREARAILALLHFLERKPNLADDAPREEVEAARFLRRKAIRALALTRYPAVVVDGKVEGRTAQDLLRVVSGNVWPEPNLSEKVEAAAGVMRLRSADLKDYQPDYAAYHLGRFLVELSDRYQKQRPLDKKDKNEEVTPGPVRDSLEPWKVYGARLGEALEALKADTKGQPEAAYLAQFTSRGERILKVIQGTSQGGLEGLASDLNRWVSDSPPKNSTVYKGLADSAIKGPDRAEGAEK
jgi:hypothetical protein